MITEHELRALLSIPHENVNLRGQEVVVTSMIQMAPATILSNFTIRSAHDGPVLLASDHCYLFRGRLLGSPVEESVAIATNATKGVSLIDLETRQYWRHVDAHNTNNLRVSGLDAMDEHWDGNESQHAIYASYCEGLQIEGSLIQATKRAGIALREGTSAVVADCQTIDTGQGDAPHGNGLHAAGTRELRVERLSVTGALGAGISLAYKDYAQSVGGVMEDGSLRDCSIYGSRNPPSGLGHGLDVVAQYPNILEHLLVDGLRVTSCPGEGARLEGQEIQFRGGFIENCGRHGIHVVGTAVGVQISDAAVLECGQEPHSSPTSPWVGIWVDGKRVTVSNARFRAGSTQPTAIRWGATSSGTQIGGSLDDPMSHGPRPFRCDSPEVTQLLLSDRFPPVESGAGSLSVSRGGVASVHSPTGWRQL